MMNKIKLPTLIGISGKINSGKDLTGKMLRYLLSPNAKEKGSYLKCEEYGLTYDVDYKIVKFADKIKDMVCLILGCTREQLENTEFKNYTMTDLYEKGIITEEFYTKLDD